MGRGGRPERLDLLMLRRGLASTREEARALIDAGRVRVDGFPARSGASRVRSDRAIALASEEARWVGRGAYKLLGALEAFDVDPTGRIAADLGASTGGFTQVLLRRGASRVYAVDVGRGQLDWTLRQDERVVLMEGVNARHLRELPEPIALLCADLSFISLDRILLTVRRLLAPEGEAILLVKPQFEAPPEQLAPGGALRDASARLEAIDRIRQAAVSAGLSVLGGADSVLAGARAGNVEYFLHVGSAEPTRGFGGTLQEEDDG